MLQQKYTKVTFLFKLLIVEKVFKETLGHDLGDNCKTFNRGLFQKEMVTLIREILLQNNIC